MKKFCAVTVELNHGLTLHVPVEWRDLSELCRWGHYDGSTKAITICESHFKVPKSKRSEAIMATLAHEVGHAIFDSLHWNMTGSTLDFQEQVVEQYAFLLRKSKDVFKFEYPKVKKGKKK